MYCIVIFNFPATSIILILSVWQFNEERDLMSPGCYFKILKHIIDNLIELSKSLATFVSAEKIIFGLCVSPSSPVCCLNVQ